MAVALGLTLLTLGVGRWRGIALHSIEVVGAVYFAALALVGAVAPDTAGIFEWLPSFVLVTGIVGWIADAFGEAVGITLIAAGIVGGAVMRRLAPSDGK